MYLQPSESVGSAAFPVVVVIAVSTIAAIAIAALLVLAIARRALERTTPDKVPIVIDALAAMLGQLGLPALVRRERPGTLADPWQPSADHRQRMPS